MLNPSTETCIESIFNLNTESTSLVDVLVTTIAEPPLLSATTLPPPTIPFITHLQLTPAPTPTTVPLVPYSVSLIPGIVDTYLPNKMHEAVKIAIQLQSDRLRDEAQAENKDFINKLDDNIKKIIKDQTSYAVATNLFELELKKILIDKMESNKSIHIYDEQKNLYKALVDAYKSDKLILDMYGDTISFKRCRDDKDKDKEPSAGSNRGSKRRRARKEPVSTSIQKEKTSMTIGKSTEGSKYHHKSAQAEEPMHTAEDLEEPAHQDTLAQKEDTRKSFDELMDTSLDFSAFVMNRLKIDTLTPELLAGPTFELMKGSCKSQQYPHDLRKPLPLIPNSRGRQVIPFDHFINNDLAYLSCGVSSRTYTTSVTKTKAADYGNIKWIEDLVLNRMWRNFLMMSTPNAESLLSQSFKLSNGIITSIWIGSPFVEMMTSCKLTNFTVKERLAFNVSLRMFTRSIVIQRRVEDLQLGVKSYQKKLNLTKPDTYRLYLKRKEAYTAYSNPRGFIYQNKDKKNKLIRIDELHKFSDGTLNDVRTALNDHLKGIRMKYLPQNI
ncbi:hypothetical protein Tco_1116045 [Tanacetum coccineum]